MRIPEIFVADVKAAYDRTGYKPVQRTYKRCSDKSACALGVLGIDKIGEDVIFGVYKLAEVLGLPVEFCFGVIDAFDGYQNIGKNRPEYENGFECGVAARKEFFGGEVHSD